MYKCRKNQALKAAWFFCCQYKVICEICGSYGVSFLIRSCNFAQARFLSSSVISKSDL